MKKILMTVALAATALVSAQAQSELKPLAGQVTTDFTLFANGIFNTTNSPVGSVSNLGLNTAALKGRYFLMDNLALRATLGLDNASTTDKNSDPLNEVVKKSNTFTLGLGIEQHFGGTDRLSPYIGAELAIGSVSGSEKTVTKTTTTTTKNAPRFLFGGTLLLGADYYVAPHVYLGVEAGLDLKTTSLGKGSTTIVQNNGNNTVNESKATSSSSEFATGVKAGFKIGFVF